MTRSFFDSIFGGLGGSAVSSVVWNQLWQVTLVALFVAMVVKLTCRTRPHLAHTLWLLVLIKYATPPLWSSEVGVFSYLASRIAPTRMSGGEATIPASTFAGTIDVLPGEWTTAAVTAEPTASGKSAEAPPVTSEVPEVGGAERAAQDRVR